MFKFSQGCFWQLSHCVCLLNTLIKSLTYLTHKKNLTWKYRKYNTIVNIVIYIFHKLSKVCVLMV